MPGTIKCTAPAALLRPHGSLACAPSMRLHASMHARRPPLQACFLSPAWTHSRRPRTAQCVEKVAFAFTRSATLAPRHSERKEDAMLARLPRCPLHGAVPVGVIHTRDAHSH